MEDLIDKVLDQIQADIEDGDLTAVAALLGSVPVKDLMAYLPEHQLTKGETS